MSPNPYILLRNLVSPTSWLKASPVKPQQSKGRIEHWETPIPGLYEYIPGRGWFLVAVDTDDGDKLDKPVPLTYCRVLHRYMLKDDFESRKRWGVVQDDKGIKKKGVLFRMDDGNTWVYCWNEMGEFDRSERKIPYCIDSDTRNFRIMTAADQQSASSVSSNKTTRQASVARSEPAHTSSIWSFAAGDVHAKSVRGISLQSTQSSTRASTRPSSSHGSGFQHGSTHSSLTTPPSLVELQFPKFDAPELDRRLKGLTDA